MAKRSLRNLARRMVTEAASKDGGELKLFLRQVVDLLHDEGLLVRWREFEQEVHAAWKEKYGVSKVTVVSAHELTKEAKEHLKTFTGGAELITLINPRLLGGAVVRADEQRIDGSILGTLTRLKQKLGA